MKKILTAPKGAQYLSDVTDVLPTCCLFDKGVTGCGGTTLEILSKRDSVILVPTVNLVLNKTYAYPNLIGVHGDVTRDEFMMKCRRPHAWLKIIATYDSLPKLEDWMGNALYKCFLLVDEYHILFNSYAFRHEAVSYVLRKYRKFERYCFMTATPLDECNTLEELKDLSQVCVKWPEASKVKVTVDDVYFTSRRLIQVIEQLSGCNLHVFMNSINTIRSVIKNTKMGSYRTICSKNARQADLKLGGRLHVQSINSPVRKVNFYTATAFEGVDIYDPDGRIVIVSDTCISQSLMDISTLFVQICGRLRNSKYKNEVLFIVNTGKHRYLKCATEDKFMENSETVRNNAVKYGEEFARFGEAARKVSLGMYDHSVEYSQSLYLSKHDDVIAFDPNLQRLDIQNYKIVMKVFDTSLSVINTVSATGKAEASPALDPVCFDMAKVLKGKRAMTYFDFCLAAYPVLSKYGMTSQSDIAAFLDKYASRKRQSSGGKRERVYDFLKLQAMVEISQRP